MEVGVVAAAVKRRAARRAGEVVAAETAVEVVAVAVGELGAGVRLLILPWT